MELKPLIEEDGAFLGFFTEGHVPITDMARAVKQRLGLPEKYGHHKAFDYVPEYKIAHEYTCSECGMLGEIDPEAHHAEVGEEDSEECVVTPVTVYAVCPTNRPPRHWRRCPWKRAV